MAKVIPLSHLLKILGFCIIAVVCLLLGSEFTESVFQRADASIALRWGAVVVGTVSIVPWLWTVFWGVTTGDEFVQRVALVGTALAFVVAIVVNVAFGLLQDARIVGWDRHLQPVPTAIILWTFGVSVAALYYRF